MNYFSKLKIKKQAGFTLIELLIVMVIAAFIMTSLVIQQSKWNNRLAVSTQAYELALMVRQAQVYALGVRENSAASGDKFNTGYGVYFDSNNSNQYIFYGDLNRNGNYDSGEEIEIKPFNRNVAIYDLCAVKVVGQLDYRCSSEGGNVSRIQIFFYRPDPKAVIKFFNNSGNPSSNVGPKAGVYVKDSKNTAYFHVDIMPTGQISVEEGISTP
jgi:prepilin-type N-terminal cleavage/methylation domain-containing protein